MLGDMTWIRTIAWPEADGQLKEAYDWQAAALGSPAEFTILGSLYPAIVEERLRLYRVVEHCPSSLTPVERQAAALTTSLLNGTGHCASGLQLKLRSLGVSEDAIHEIRQDPATPTTGEPRLDSICRHAAKLTLTPKAMAEDDLVSLRTHGLSDLDLLDLNNIVSYYNYINRVVMGLGLRSEIATTHEATNALPGDEANQTS